MAEFLHTQADERRAELERAGELPARWATAYPSAREWSRRLNEARTLRLTWEPEARGRTTWWEPLRLA